MVMEVATSPGMTMVESRALLVLRPQTRQRQSRMASRVVEAEVMSEEERQRLADTTVLGLAVAATCRRKEDAGSWNGRQEEEEGAGREEEVLEACSRYSRWDPLVEGKAVCGISRCVVCCVRVRLRVRESEPGPDVAPCSTKAIALLPTSVCHSPQSIHSTLLPF